MNSEKNNLQNLVIIGIGIIGGSIAKKLHKKYNIYGISEKIIHSNIFKDFTFWGDVLQVENFLTKADVIIIATPLFAYDEIFKKLSKISNIYEKMIIEFGSVKGFPIKLKQKYSLHNLIACHPIAGSQLSGFNNSSSNLFVNKLVILDDENYKNSNLDIIFQQLEVGEIRTLNSRKHDEIYAKVSHFPQLLSFIFQDIITKFSFLEMDLTLQSDENYKKFRRLGNASSNIWKGGFGIFNLNICNLEKMFIDFQKYIMDNIQNILTLAHLATEFSQYSLHTTLKLEKYYGAGILDFTSFKNHDMYMEYKIDGNLINDFLQEICLIKYVI